MSKFPPEKTQLSQQENTTAEVLRQAHFEAFFAGANAGLLIFDRQLRYVQINEVLAQMNGLSVADHIGRSLRELVPDLASTLEPMLQGILDTGKPILNYELMGETPKQPGILRYWEASYYPLLDENNLVFGVGGIVIEVSDRKRAEKEQARLTAILEATSDLVEVADVTGHSVYLNKAGQKMLGMSPEEARSPFTLDSVLAPSARAKFHNEIIPTALRDGSWAGEMLFLSRDGEEIPVSQVLIVHKTTAGEVEFISTIVRDIRDRKQAEEALREQQAALRDRNALLNSILESTPDFIVVKDREGRHVALNSNLANFIGKPIEEIIGKDDLELLPPDTAREMMAKDRQIMAAGITESYEEDVSGGEKTTTFFTTKAPWRDTNGNILGIIATTRDITDRKQAEDAIKQSEERYRSLIAATSQLVWITDAEGRCPDIPTFRAYTGQTVDEVVGFGWLDAIHPDDSERTNQVWMEAVQTKTLYDIEYRIRGADGNYRYFQARAVPILNEDGSIREWIGTSSDIHDRKQAEDAIKQSEERYRSLILATSQIVWTGDSEGRCWDMPTLRAYTGQTEAEVIGFGWLDAIHPDDRERTAQAWMEAVQTKSLYDIEYRIRRADGNYRYFQGRAVPILNEDGSIREWVGTCTDIHDRKQAEDAIKQSEERYRSLILATSQIVWTADTEGRSPDLPTWRAYTGQTEAEVVGFGWLDTIHSDDSERTAQVWMEAVQTKSLYDIEYRIRGADGNYRYFQVRGVPILNEDGSLREWVGTCTDIHDRKQAEFLMAKAKEAAEAANRAKSEFLANMSHELRTPLNGIMGYAQILQRSKVVNEEERSRIDVIYQCGSHLLTLINDILDLSKIEAQKVELQPTDFHFPAFLQGVAEMCRIRAELKGIQFHFPSSPELPIGIHADEKRLRQVLINLLSNAIKFTDAGSVTFIVSFATEAKIRFEIRDTGTGIAQDQLQTIFQPFEQVGDRRRQTEGTGLGLAISKRIVELMGSTIQVQSEMNVGSIFWFDVDLYQAEEWVKTSQIDHRGQIIGIKDRQPKIVVIDDKWANRSVVSNLLSPIGFEVFEANDGQEGWEKILEVQPDLIVTDLLMPELDGYELIKRVRDSENFKDIVIIVSSASVFETDQYRSLEAGGNTFIPKPVQATELLEKLQKYLDLEWVYEAKEDPLAIASDTNELISPPATEMEILYELAMKGNFREIVKQAVLLEEIDPKYIPFAKRLHQMAKDFQDEEILIFIQSYK